jgi:hypothetical protein
MSKSRKRKERKTKPYSKNKIDQIINFGKRRNLIEGAFYTPIYGEYPIKHPLWKGFVEWVESGQTDVATRLLTYRYEDWHIVWVIYLAGYKRACE